MIKKRTTQKPTLFYAAKIFVVYLKALHLPYTRYQTYIRGLRHILRFYGHEHELEQFNGRIMLQYADLFDPYSESQTIAERGEVFWKFMFFLKRNEMIPEWTEPEKRAG
jgi:hypothetical protein